MQIRHVSPVAYRTAPPAVSRVYRALESEFGLLAPPIALHAPSPDVLAASWVMLREAMIAPGSVGLAAKEAVAVAVSEHNSCPFCITVHSAMLNSLTVHGASDPAPAIADHQAARDWARANTARPGVSGRTDGPGPDHRPELVAVAVLLHYLNRMAQIFLGPVPLPRGIPHQSLRVVMPVLSWLRRSAGPAASPPGRSVGLLPAARVPSDLAWTAGGPSHLAEAFGRAAAVIDTAGERSVPAPVRALVRATLREWDGRPPGISRAWVEPLLREVPSECRAHTRLALLVALAPYQVDGQMVADVRAADAADSRLIDLVAWASMAAAREAGAWMAAE
ncbi:carboxymuconolactone decarboxylase family protein [Streptomyces sp. S.PB5]|uniref:carboxymuconolactone decarboxylase family protein n=1 Tax=Streptomyces sp. S.PB5 TaxID=3020844 RepID=UPI0025B0AC1C|nr:carboxymuconolactone decarboxylase family protein [Streptomyces sp. S.PB5]MDN3022781.1 carboxymuconolactone decarboxylase family protein [Streptomyces sp. S.PB5]